MPNPGKHWTASTTLRAAAWCFGRRPPGTWLADMQSRLYWNTLMFESVLTDELSLLTSQLSDLQDRVPLPKFVKMEVPALQRLEEPNSADAFCHYHFLSQIAHRVLIYRIKETIYYSGSYPPSSLEDEFTYQLEQWRHQLPAAIQFEVDSEMPPSRFPRDVVVTPWLRARYLVAKWHISRPFL
ncbi:uncharacterized protein FRV6_11678 [Fusarium oxysporum]|uniref:Transcription factor domain-containing protein n=1 Tax=Fusarium oxysporum TaxID=5507 RepID=A0A2H3TPB9_FUSOX|nr:uncharacterized protein FRV6_11678 [Fusarium oxysporum]